MKVSCISLFCWRSCFGGEGSSSPFSDDEGRLVAWLGGKLTPAVLYHDRRVRPRLPSHFSHAHPRRFPERHDQTRPQAHRRARQAWSGRSGQGGGSYGTPSPPRYTRSLADPNLRAAPQKLVRNHPRIVNMIEASVSELPGGVNGSKGYEIYILMEWCAGEQSLADPSPRRAR